MTDRFISHDNNSPTSTIIEQNFHQVIHTQNPKVPATKTSFRLIQQQTSNKPTTRKFVRSTEK